ncbi:MAG TPA: carboxypeptidase-like regulatory domain-containing protein [Chitinivibrionales bacterium]|nr:carboxypeptidase-like regulatory domain-containing protein [Chitinivibrionales bacterium]
MKIKQFPYMVFLSIFVAALVMAGCSKKNSNPAGTKIPQDYTVKITVLDSAGQPVKGARVWFDGQNDTAVTDSTGRATLTSPAGSQILQAKSGTQVSSHSETVPAVDSITVLSPIILGSAQMVPMYVMVDDPQGQPFGGVRVWIDGTTDTAVTNVTGKAVLDASPGTKNLFARLGIFGAQEWVTIHPGDTAVTAPALRLAQNSSVKILVLKAPAESLEVVLKAIGFTTFDTMSVDTLGARADSDTVAAASFLGQYGLVFLDCIAPEIPADLGGTSLYISMSHYIEQGGVVYGGHYGYFALEAIFAPYYQNINDGDQQPADTLLVLDTAMAANVGYSQIAWQSTDGSGRMLSGYETFSDLPPNAHVMGAIKGTNPLMAVIIENYLGRGRLLWTNYHNQDIVSFPQLLKIVKYTMYNLSKIN